LKGSLALTYGGSLEGRDCFEFQMVIYSII